MKTIAEKTYSNYNKVMSVKASHRNWNYIVLVRVGEYYESYEEDADIVSGVCGVGQFKHRGCLLNMAVFGKDMLDVYLPKLVRAGHKVAIMDNTLA